MSDAPEGGNTPSGDTPPAEAPSFQPITSQDDLNRIIADRVQREQKKFADYKDVKAKAERLDEIEKANQSEAEKVAERLRKADEEISSVPSKVADALRTHLVALHEINAEDAELFLTATDPDLLLKQVSRLTAREQSVQAERKKQGNHVPREGTNNPSPESDAREVARALFSGA